LEHVVGGHGSWGCGGGESNGGSQGSTNYCTRY
jgi:hypothetical protein